MRRVPPVPNYLEPSWWDRARFWWAWWRIGWVRDKAVRVRLGDLLWNAWVGRFHVPPPSRQLHEMQALRSRHFGL